MTCSGGSATWEISLVNRRTFLATSLAVATAGHAARTANARSFLPVFWSPIWFPNQQPNTMGILCDPKRQALTQFPTDFYSNWQWYDLLQNSRTVNLNDTLASFRAIVEVIDNFASNNKCSNLFEERVGRGSLLVCTMNLTAMADHNSATSQLLNSLIPTWVPILWPPEELGILLLNPERSVAQNYYRLGPTR